MKAGQAAPRAHHNKITSFEIAEYMISSRDTLSARELSVILARLHPTLEVDSREVYLRLRSIAASKYSSVQVFDASRPRRFRIESLDPEFYRRSRGPRRYSERLLKELRMSVDDKEQREHQGCLTGRHLMDEVLRRRQSL